MELMYCVGKGKGMAIFFRHLGTVEVDSGSDLSSEPLDTFYSLLQTLTIKLCQCVRWHRNRPSGLKKVTRECSRKSKTHHFHLPVNDLYN